MGAWRCWSCVALMVMGALGCSGLFGGMGWMVIVLRTWWVWKRASLGEVGFCGSDVEVCCSLTKSGDCLGFRGIELEFHFDY